MSRRTNCTPFDARCSLYCEYKGGWQFAPSLFKLTLPQPVTTCHDFTCHQHEPETTQKTLSQKVKIDKTPNIPQEGSSNLTMHRHMIHII